MPLSIPYSIVDGIAASGNNLGANFDAIETWSVDVIESTSSGIVPTGTILDFVAVSPPAGFLVCDGSLVSRVTYSALFAVVGTTFGVGDGSSTFGLPDLRGKFTVGRDGAEAAFIAVGSSGGARDAVVGAHTHTTPVHSHSFSATSAPNGLHSHNVDIDHNHASFASTSSGGHSHSVGTLATASSGSHTHTNDKLIIAQDGSASTLGLADGNVWGGVWGEPLNVHSLALAAGGLHQHTLTGATGIETAHTHTIDVPALGLTTKTTGVISDHTHSVSGTTGTATPTTDSTGVSVTDANLPPFVTVVKIIKT